MKYIAVVPLRTKEGKVPKGKEVEIKDPEAAKKLLAAKQIKEIK